MKDVEISNEFNLLHSEHDDLILKESNLDMRAGMLPGAYSEEYDQLKEKQNEVIALYDQELKRKYEEDVKREFYAQYIKESAPKLIPSWIEITKKQKEADALLKAKNKVTIRHETLRLRMREQKISKLQNYVDEAERKVQNSLNNDFNQINRNDGKSKGKGR